jgi:hypothetical protein
MKERLSLQASTPTATGTTAAGVARGPPRRTGYPSCEWLSAVPRAESLLTEEREPILEPKEAGE